VEERIKREKNWLISKRWTSSESARIPILTKCRQRPKKSVSKKS